MNLPARTVSGDFFDYFDLPDGRICFNLGDVSGKGINASLLMAKTSSLYRCLGKSIPDPGRLLQLINREIFETTTRGMFVTMVAGLYDPARGTVRIVHEHLAIPSTRKEPRLEDHRDRHGMERVLVPAEVERVIVPHAASGRRQAFDARSLPVALLEQRHDL